MPKHNCPYCSVNWFDNPEGSGHFKPCSCLSYRCDSCQRWFDEPVPLREAPHFYMEGVEGTTIPEAVCQECADAQEGHPHRYLIYDLICDEMVLPDELARDVDAHIQVCERCSKILDEVAKIESQYAFVA